MSDISGFLTSRRYGPNYVRVICVGKLNKKHGRRILLDYASKFPKNAETAKDWVDKECVLKGFGTDLLISIRNCYAEDVYDFLKSIELTDTRGVNFSLKVAWAR